jgi:hypothetical protein
VTRTPSDVDSYAPEGSSPVLVANQRVVLGGASEAGNLVNCRCQQGFQELVPS